MKNVFIIPVSSLSLPYGEDGVETGIRSPTMKDREKLILLSIGIVIFLTFVFLGTEALKASEWADPLLKQ